MHWYTCKCLLNTLEKTVEQLAWCLAKETKLSSRGQSTTTRNAEIVAYPLMNTPQIVSRNLNKMTYRNMDRGELSLSLLQWCRKHIMIGPARPRARDYM